MYSISTALRRVSIVQSVRFLSSTQYSLCSKLFVIGGGKMAESILNAIGSKGVQNMKDVHVYDVDEDRLDFIKKTYNVNVCHSIQEGIDGADLIILSVKPQNVEEVAKSIMVPPRGVLLSIVAGFTIGRLQEAFRTQLVIRSMPNTPAMVLEGMTVWTATKDIPPDMVEKARTLLGSTGEQVEVKDERYLDMATAVSGSGPAYIFLTMEAMVDAAVHVGFPREVAIRLVLATIRGSASYAQQSKESVSALRANVTSPGGTTASALYELEKGGFRTVVADAIWAAYRRALELGGNNPNVGPGRNKFQQ